MSEIEQLEEILEDDDTAERMANVGASWSGGFQTVDKVEVYRSCCYGRLDHVITKGPSGTHYRWGLVDGYRFEGPIKVVKAYPRVITEWRESE
jgi:hypothetical protein